MNPSLTRNEGIGAGGGRGVDLPSDQDLARQIFDIMIQAAGDKPGYRPVHAKGIVCQGMFVPSREAATLSKAAHFQGASVPVTIRFSDGGPDPSFPATPPDPGPRGMAIPFPPAAD